MSLGRRGFLGRLFGIAAVAAVEPSTFLEQRFAAVEVPPFECADLVAAALKRTYDVEFFHRFEAEFTPLLEGLDEAPPGSGSWNVPFYLAPGGP